LTKIGAGRDYLQRIDTLDTLDWWVIATIQQFIQDFIVTSAVKIIQKL
jgi:hypothetical protein